MISPNQTLHTNRRAAFCLRTPRFLRALDSLPAPVSGGGR